MPVITRLIQGKKNPHRVNLYIDGVFAFALSLDEVAKQGLKPGLALTETQLASLKQTDEDQYLYAKILNFLSYRPRTIHEVRARLRKYGLTALPSQNKIIQRLQSSGYLDDLAFARWFIESRNTHKPRSVRLLQHELKVKGVSEAIIKSVTKDIADEQATIAHILSRKLGQPRKLDPETRQKISRLLARQGFPWVKVKEVVKNWESE